MNEIPTRLHADPLHPDFHPMAQNCIVTLDGDPQRCAIFADQERGVLLRFVLDERGRLIVEQGRPRFEVVLGTVRIMLRGGRRHG